MNYLLSFVCLIGLAGAQISNPEDDGCNELRLRKPVDPLLWVCRPVSQCSEITLVLNRGMTVTPCGLRNSQQICCPTLNYSDERFSHFDISPTPTATKMATIVFDSNCDSLREKYVHFKWSCESQNYCQGKELLKLYLMERAGCGQENDKKICCPSDDHLLKSTTPHTTPPKREIDLNCNVIRERYQKGTTANRFTWSCEKQCNDKRLVSHIDERVSCDHRDESKVCCPVPHEYHAATPPPVSSTYSIKSSIAAQSEPSRTTPYTEIATPTLLNRKSTTPLIHTVFQQQKPMDFDIDCQRISQKYHKIVEWTCEKQPCPNQPLNVLNTLALDKTECDPKDVKKICCATITNKFNSNRMTTRKPSPVTRGQGQGTTDKYRVKTKETTTATTTTTTTTDDVKHTTQNVRPLILNSPDAMSDETLQELKDTKYNTFDRDFLSILSAKRQNENIVVSPLSIKLLLALLMEGSGGDTTMEITRALRLPKNKRKASNLLQRLQYLILERSPNITLESKNKIYKAADVIIQTLYEYVVTNSYATEIESMDFSNPDMASHRINTWVNDVTHGLIPALVEKENIKESTKLLLVNYIYLKANWDIEFNRQFTRKGCFHTLKNPNECQDVWFMSKKRGVRYQNSNDFDAQIVEIPFKDSRYVIDFVLPNGRGRVYEVLNKLSRKDVYDLFNNLELTSVDLSLPRTTIDFSGDMVDLLKHDRFGMKELFRPTADFSNMVNNNSQIGVSNIIHKARIEINEEGTKAVGVSGGNVQTLSLTMETIVVFDHPFLFFIRDTRIAGFLFEGIVVSPDKAEAAKENRV